MIYEYKGNTFVLPIYFREFVRFIEINIRFPRFVDLMHYCCIMENRETTKKISERVTIPVAPNTLTPDMLTPGEAAAVLRITSSQLTRWINEGTIPREIIINIRGTKYFEKEDILKWLRSHKGKPAAAGRGKVGRPPKKGTGGKP